MSQIHIRGRIDKKPCSLSSCLCLLRGGSEGCDVFHVQLIKVSIQEYIALSAIGAFVHALFSSSLSTVCTAMSITLTCDTVA